jgi:hypothetical protein
VTDDAKFEMGYGWLGDRVAKAMQDAKAMRPVPGSIAANEDPYFRPACRTFEHCIMAPLHSALDHLELVAETLNNRAAPGPYAESTLIRTAITAASTALWMLMPDDTPERRRRTLEFIFRDVDGYLSHLRQVRSEGFPEDDEQAAEIDRIIVEMPADRLEWIVARLNELSPLGSKAEHGATPITVEGFRRGRPYKTTDTKIVTEAAAVLDPVAPGGFDAAAQLVSVWKHLSGFAHGLSWQSVSDWQVQAQDEVTGKLTITVKADPNRLLNTGFAAVIVTEKAISRWGELCAPPSIAPAG